MREEGVFPTKGHFSDQGWFEGLGHTLTPNTGTRIVGREPVLSVRYDPWFEILIFNFLFIYFNPNS